MSSSNPKEQEKKVNWRDVIIIGVALTAMAVVEWPYAHNNPLELLNLIPVGLLASITWELPQKLGLTTMLQTAEGVRELAKFIAIDASLYFLAKYGLKYGVDKLSALLPNERESRKINGVEPIREKETPATVIIGSTEIISDIASLRNSAHDPHHPVVGIHIDPHIPPALGTFMDYHFGVTPDELLDLHAHTINRRLSTIHATGLDRSPLIEIFCVNPDNGIYYGDDARPDFPPNFVSTLLKKISTECSLKGKTVAVTLSQELFLGGASSVVDELKNMAAQYEFNLILKTPETRLIAEIKSDLDKLSVTKEPNKPLNILLAGEGKKPIDARMLENFKTALAAIEIPGHRVNVELSDHHSSTPLKPADKNKKVDMIVPYGDTDEGTSSLVRMLVGLGYQPSQIYPVIERGSRLWDVDGLCNKPYALYSMLLSQ